MKKIYAIILAGGKGKRMASNISKQFIKLNEKPIIYYTLKAFRDCKKINKIILVLPKDEMKFFNQEIARNYDLKVDKIVQGGLERQESVYNALKSINDCDIVLIHDGARPFVSQKIINDGIKFASMFKAAAPGVMPKDTIKMKDKDNLSKNTLDRSKLVAVQTPQCFDYNLILKSHEFIKEKELLVTDDTAAVEYLGGKVYLFDGDYTNIKITTQEDLILAKWLSKDK